MKLHSIFCSIVLLATGAAASLGATGCDDKKADPEATTVTHTTAGSVGILPQSDTQPNNPRSVTNQGAKLDAGATGTVTGADKVNVGGQGPGGGSGGQPQTGAGNNP